jgi:flavorubredoxin
MISTPIASSRYRRETRSLSAGMKRPSSRHRWSTGLRSWSRSTSRTASFSANAFGSFKAIDGRLWADECDWDRDFFDEARRYHCNIVGKYGPHVQLLLKKAAGVLDKIRIVAPLHGPLYRTLEDIMRYIDKMDHWASYTPEEKGVLVAYASM